jgi:hypothetical protein
MRIPERSSKHHYAETGGQARKLAKSFRLGYRSHNEVMEMRTRTELLDDLRDMMRDLIALRSNGELYPRLARAHGYVDGFMRALLDMGVVSKKELLELVAQERERASGPALRTMETAGDAAAVELSA